MSTATSELTPSQAARRERVIRAALDLGVEGGYDAVQMRDVAERAEVALGTIYRYFSSKDHLLAGAMVAWVRDLQRRVSARPPVGDTTVERVLSVMRRATKAMELQPGLAEAVVTALTSPDAGAVAEQQEVAAVMVEILDLALSDDLDPEVRAAITRTLGHVWFSALIGWVNGWTGLGNVSDEIEIAAHLLLDHLDS